MQPTSRPTDRDTLLLERRGDYHKAGMVLGVAALVLAIVALVAAFVVPGPVQSPSTPLKAWASVTESGTVLAGSGVHYVNHPSTGYYFVVFAQPYNNCTALVTPSGYPGANVVVDTYYSQPGGLNLYFVSIATDTPTNSSFGVAEYC